MAKGGGFEREISKAFTIWLTGQEKPYQYWRMPGSGGLATLHEECKNLSGDIRALTHESSFLTEYFSIECKTGYPRTNFWQLFKQIKNYDLRDFWAQCIRDAEKANKKPMLIYRKKGQKIIVGLQWSEVEYFSLIHKALSDKANLTARFETKYGLPSVTFFDFYEFIEIVKPDTIKYISERFCNDI